MNDFFHALHISLKQGVPLFFVLSGFLITYLLISERNIFGSINIQFFYIRRILRIWPLYYIIILFGFFLFPVLRHYIGHSNYNESANYWMYHFFLSNFDQINNGRPIGMGLGVTWSISIEEQFYLLWPLLLKYIPKVALEKVLIGFLIVAMLFDSFYNFPSGHSISGFFDLTMGSLLAISLIKKRKFLNYFNQVSTLKALGLFAFGILFILFSYGWQDNYNLFTQGIINLIFCQLIIYHCSESKKSFGNIPGFNFLGKYTYGLYLLHPISIQILKYPFNNIGNPHESNGIYLFIFIIGSLSLSIFFAIASYHLYELKFLKLKKRFSFLDTSSNK